MEGQEQRSPETDTATDNESGREEVGKIENSKGNKTTDQSTPPASENEAVDLGGEKESNKTQQPKKLDYGLTLLQDSIFYDDEIHINPHLINSLTEGFTEKFLPSLEKNRKTITQIKTSQNVLVETVQQENAKFKDCLAMEGLEKTMIKAKLYHAKLLKLRRDMTSLHDKSAKLKRRALRLQQQKQKEELTRAQQMEIEYEKEKMLTARVAPSSPTSSSPDPPRFTSSSSS